MRTNSMAKVAAKDGLKPWDARPWPKRGDDSIEVLYVAQAVALDRA
jgi:hypothetical protein